MRVWFETHATSTDNESGLSSGHLDPPLSEAGRVQAAELGQRWKNRGLASVYTSDLRRATETAEIAFADQSVRIFADTRLRECDYGSWSGCRVEKMQAARADFIDQPFPGGESFRDVVRRIDDFLRGLKDGNEPLLIIAHRAPWYALEHLLLGRDLHEVVISPWKWQPGWEYHLKTGIADAAR